MNKNLSHIYNLLQEIAWQFGSHGFNGECCGDLSLAEFMALKKTYENINVSVQEIGNAINFTKSGATRIVDRLEKKGYITRERSLIDGRVCCVKITAKGKDVITNIIEKYTEYLDKVLMGLEPQKVEDIKDALEVLVKSVHQQEFE